MPDKNTNIRCRLEWGRRGCLKAVERRDIPVIVDVLSFSSLVATAVNHGGLIYPCRESDNPEALADQIEGSVTVRRKEVPAKGRYSLSPLTYFDIETGTRVVVVSPNGATCSRLGFEAPLLLVGCLLNARSTARAVSSIMMGTDFDVSIVACGEREKTNRGEGAIRWAVEDYLGAGAILSDIPFAKSADACVCENAFRASKKKLDTILRDCPSGCELAEAGFEEDIVYCSRLDYLEIVPGLTGDHFNAFDNEKFIWSTA